MLIPIVIGMAVEGRHNLLQMPRWAALVAVLALLSCNALPSAKPAPSGPLGDVVRQMQAVTAPNADVVDRPIEDLLARLDLQKAYGASANGILDQVRKTRAAVAAMRSSTSGTAGPRLASVARSVGAFSIPVFANEFAAFLDPLTQAGGTRSLPARPFSSQENGADSFTTTTLSTTETFSGAGSKVTASVHWTYTTITISTAPGGATLLHLQDDRELVGTIDVCPDGNGTVPATLHTTTKIVAQTSATTTTRNSTGDTEFAGSVNDQAALTSVTQRNKVETSWESASGNGGVTADTSVTWTVGSDGSLIGAHMDESSFSGSIVARGAASDAEASAAAGWDMALTAFALDPAFKSARDLWRAGRCVVVMAPDYAVETPIKVEEQTKSQKDTAVDESSETKFSVKLRHRFEGGSLAQPITANLSGEKTLEPNRLDSTGTLTYKAPDDEGKKATATLRSTSKRGIGTLLLDFHTASQALTLTITGTLKSANTFATDIQDQVTIGPLEFKKQGGDVWEATGTWTTRIHWMVNAAGSYQTCDGSETGNVTWQARTEKRGKDTVWVIDPNDADFDDGSGTLNCFTPPVTIRGVTIGGNTTSDSPGGSGGIFAFDLGSFTVPAEGGQIPVGGATGTSAGRGGFVASGTAKAVTKK